MTLIFHHKNCFPSKFLDTQMYRPVDYFSAAFSKLLKIEKLCPPFTVQEVNRPNNTVCVFNLVVNKTRKSCLQIYHHIEAYGTYSDGLYISDNTLYC